MMQLTLGRRTSDFERRGLRAFVLERAAGPAQPRQARAAHLSHSGYPARHGAHMPHARQVHGMRSRPAADDEVDVVRVVHADRRFQIPRQQQGVPVSGSSIINAANEVYAAAKR